MAVCEEEAFYPGISYGKGIVDACVFLVSSNPYNRVENIMVDYGIQVDIQSIRRYAIRFGREARKHAHLKVMGQRIDLGANLLKIIFGRYDVKDLKKGRPKEDGQKKCYDSMMDETHPPVKGSKEAHARNNRLRKALGQKPGRFGESFTLAS